MNENPTNDNPEPGHAAKAGVCDPTMQGDYWRELAEETPGLTVYTLNSGRIAFFGKCDKILHMAERERQKPPVKGSSRKIDFDRLLGSNPTLRKAAEDARAAAAFGEQMRQLRTEHGISHEEMARRLGTERYVSYFERGLRVPPRERLTPEAARAPIQNKPPIKK